MKITQVEESGYKLVLKGNLVAFEGEAPAGFQFSPDNDIVRVALELRRFLLRGTCVIFCGDSFVFQHSPEPEDLRAHLTAWGTKGRTLEEVENEIIRWYKTRPVKKQVTLDTWEVNGWTIIKVPFGAYPYELFASDRYLRSFQTLEGAIDYARRNS